MSLELFANFERTSNSSLFYRTTQASPYTITYKLSDLMLPGGVSIPDYFQAKFSINGGELNAFPVIDDKYILSVACNTTVPVVCSLFVEVTSTITNQTESFSLCSIFVEHLPEANFVVWPTTAIYLNGNNVASISSVISYQHSPGAYFYGEGHTETFGLDVTNYKASNTANWFIGSEISSFTSGQSATGGTTFVALSSSLNESSVRPIHLMLTDDTINLNSPIVTYRDEDGVKQFYSFFSSTLNVDGKENEQNTTFKQSISVLPYPDTQPISLINTTDNSVPVYLPFDYSPQLFIAKIEDTFLSGGIITEQFVGSQWNLASDSEFAAWGGEGDYFVTTNFLSAVKAYQYQLQYQKETWNPVNYFNVTPLASSVTTVTVSAYKQSKINLEPYDWKEKYTYQTVQLSLSTLPLPFSTIYTPNYYVLKKEPCPIEIVALNVPSNLEVTKMTVATNLYSSGFTVDRIGLWSDNGVWNDTETWKDTFNWPPGEERTTSIASLSGELVFSEAGSADLYVDVFFVDNRTNTENRAFYIYPEALEVLEEYDDVNEEYYQTSLTPLNLTVTKQPELSPNEWATANNVNSLFLKFYSVIEELERRTKLVVPKSKFIGLLETKADSLTAYNNWKFESVDIEDFPLNSCRNSESSVVSDIVHIPSTGQFLIAHPTTLNVVSDERYPITLITRSNANEIYGFQNIVAAGITPEERFVILDDVLLSVYVLSIKDGELALITEWGGFGSTNNANQFNSPSDLHIDQEGSIYVSDTGNECVKKFAVTGKNLMTLTSEWFSNNPPLSVCVDSEKRIHCLTGKGVYVFDYNGSYLFYYAISSDITGLAKINSNYNREAVYITHESGVVKYFKTGIISDHTLTNYKCGQSNETLKTFSSVIQDENRNVFVISQEKILKIADVIKTTESKASINPKYFWTINDVMINKEEYIQPWVYLKSFHRLWDNIELLRDSLFYNESGCNSYIPPTYSKEELVLGQNEFVSNAIINRLCYQLWTNLDSIVTYFKTNCE